MPGPSLGGSLGGQPAGTQNIKNLPKIASIQPGHFLLVETEPGTTIIDFSDFLIGKKNITFANELSTFGVDISNSLSNMDTVTAALFAGGSDLFVKGLSCLNVLSAVGGIQIGGAGLLRNNGGIYTFNVPVSTTFTFFDSGGNSDQWNIAYTAVNAGSAKWWSTHNAITAASANWDKVYSTTNTESADWEKVVTTVRATSATWGGGSSKFTDGGAVTYLTSTADRLAVGHTTGDEKLSVSGNLSASLQVYTGTSNSINWTRAYSTVNTNSGNWEAAIAGFKTITTSGQTNVVADSGNDTLTLSAMGGFEIHHHAGSDRIILSGGASGGGGGSGEANESSFKTISVSARDTTIPHQADIVADTSTDTLTLCAGPNIELIADSTTDTVTISARDAVGSGGGGGGSMSQFILEDDDGTEVSISNNEEVKFIGSGITTNWTDTSDGSDSDPFDLTFTVDAAQTGITSLLATDIKIGEDDQTKVDFETVNEVHVYANNANKMTVHGSGINLLGHANTLSAMGPAVFSGTTVLSGTVRTGGNVTVGGDLTVTGDDLYMGTNTDAYLLVADGTNFNPVAMSGDATITNAGVLSIAANSIDGTHIAIGSDAEGDIMYYNGTNYIRLAKGTDDHVLTMNGNVPNWEAASGGGGGASLAFKTISTSGQSDIVADGATDTLTLSGMGGLEIHHRASSDTIILSAGAVTGDVLAFQTMMLADVFR